MVPRRLLFEMICVRGFYFRCLAFLTHALDAPTHRYKFELLYFVTIRTLEAIVQCMHFQRHSNHSFRKNRPATRLISGMECIYVTAPPQNTTRLIGGMFIVKEIMDFTTSSLLVSFAAEAQVMAFPCLACTASVDGTSIGHPGRKR